MANAAIAREFGKANLGDEPRLDPVMAAPGGRAAHEGRRRSLELTQFPADVLERAHVEPRADLGDIDELAPVVETQVQRAEVSSRALRRRVAADHELLPELTLDLQPVPRPLRGVQAVALLGHDAFQPLLARRREKIRAVLEHVIAEVDDAARRHQELQAFLARFKGKAPQIAAVEPERVEEDGAHRHLAAHALDVGGPREAHALLESLKARAPAVVERHDLTVEHEALERQRAQRRRHLRVARGDELATAPAELDLVAGARRENTDAVVLDLEEPRRIRRRLLDNRREHQPIAARRDVPARGLEVRQTPPQRVDPSGAVAQLLDREPRQDRLGIALGRLRVADVLVGLLQQEPVAALAAHARERPASAQLEAEQLELELAPLDLLARRLGLQELEAAGVPHDRRAGAIVPLGNEPLEVGVLDGMVFDVHGEALLVGTHRRALGHGPALQHAVDLEPQIVVEPARRVLVDDEPVPAGRAGSAEGLRGRGWIALAPILLEVAASHAGPA